MTKESILDDLIVVKRSGQRVLFNNTKIALAIKKAFDQTRSENNDKSINLVYEDVLKYIVENYSDRKTINVEDIQDIIETKLKDNKYLDVYEAFSDYRIRRAESRKAFGIKQQHKFARAIERIINGNKELFNRTPNAILLDFGKTIAAEYTKTYILDNKLLRAHEEGSIYIHNLDYFNLGKLSSTHLICNITEDFPNDFINEVINVKNEIDGEVGINSFDSLLEPLLINRFKEKFKKTLEKYLEVAGYLEYINYKKVSEVIDKENTINLDTDIFNSFIYNKRVKDIFELSYNDSMNYTYELLETDIERVLTSLDNNLRENPKYVISLGCNDNFEGLLINNIYLKILGKKERLTNVTTIFKVKKDSNQELLNKVSELILNDKNIAISFVDNSYNKENVEYFSDGKRILENPIYDEDIASGRMIVSSISINLGRLGLKHQNNLEELYTEFAEMLDLVKTGLMTIFEKIGDKNKENYDLLFRHNIIDDDKLETGQKIRKIIKKGVLNIELAGLSECAMNFTNDEEKIKKIINDLINFAKEKAQKYTEDANLNFVVSETSKIRPLKKLMELDKAIYGINKGITDKSMYGRIDSFSKSDVLEFIPFLGKCQKNLNGGNYAEVIISKNTSVKKLLEYLNYALNNDVGFIRFSIRK